MILKFPLFQSYDQRNVFCIMNFTLWDFLDGKIKVGLKLKKIFFVIICPIFLHTLGFVYYISELCLFELLKKYFCNKLITDDEPLARFKQKFAHFAEFYELLEAVPGQRDNFALRFKCQLCKKPKIVKSDSKAPTSNLTSHINHCHPECSDDFSDAGPFKRAPRGRKNISATNNISAVSIDII